MNQTSSERNPVERLAEEFLERRRAGERPSVTEYAQRHPQWADEIREVFPALAFVEELKPRSGDTASGPALRATWTTRPDRLGDYRIIREVGRGGMGVVYEAEQISLGRRVALKVLPAPQFGNDQQKRRFEREARAAARLHHTNIVPVFGIGESDGTLFYAMQFIQGLGLDEVIVELKRLRDKTRNETHASTGETSPRPRPAAAEMAQSLLSGSLAATIRADRSSLDGGAEATPLGGSHAPPDVPADPPDRPEASSEAAEAAAVQKEAETFSGQLSDTWTDSASGLLAGSQAGSGVPKSAATYWHSVARIGLEATDALDYAHRQRILHRDIKPANLLLDTQGTVWITDFGLAKTADLENLTGTGDIVGTLRYLAPETFQGRSDGRSDIYGMGLTLYELVALRPAFEESDRGRLMRRVLESEPPRLRRMTPDVPRDLEIVIHKAIDRHPEARYQTAAELRDDLARFLADEPIRARRTAWHERLRRWARRNPAVASLAGALSAVLLMVTLASVMAAGAYRQIADERRDALREAVEERGKAENARDAAREARQREEELRRRADSLAEERRQNLYATAINLAQREWESANIERVMELLNAQRPRPGDTDLRGFEWYYLWRLCHSERQVLAGHSQPVRALAFSPDGMWLATACGDGVAFWEVESGQPKYRLSLGFHEVWSLAFSPDGATLAVGGSAAQRSGRLVVVDVASRTIRWEAGGFQRGVCGVMALAYSPDGKMLAVGTAAYNGQGGVPANRLIWILARQREQEIQLWDVETGTVRSALPGKTGGILALAFSPDGGTLASGGWDRTVRLWEVPSGRLLTERSELNGYVWSVAFSPDGSLLGSASGKWDGPPEIHLWTATDLKEQSTWRGHATGVTAIAFSPDGKLLASAGWDRRVKLWEVATGTEQATFAGHRSYLCSVAFSPDGKLLASGGWDQTARLWYVDQRRDQTTFSGPEVPCYSAAFSPDDKRLAVSNPDVQILDTASGEFIARHEQLGGDDLVAYSPDGRSIASASMSGVALLRDAESGEVLHMFSGHQGKIWALTFSPNGRLLATGGQDSTVRLWDTSTGEQRMQLEGSGGSVRFLAFSRDGQLLAGCCHLPATPPATDVRIWDVDTGRLVHTLAARRGGMHTQNVEAVAFSSDGSFLATCGHDRTARLWDTRRWTRRAVLKGHLDTIYHLALSPDDRTLATASWDGTVKLWDTATGQLLATLDGNVGVVYWVAFSHDQRTLVAGSGHIVPGSPPLRQLKFWHAARDDELESPADAVADLEGLEQALLENHSAAVAALDWSRDGTLFASGDTQGSVALHEHDTRELRKAFQAHSAGILSVALSSDGTLLATASRDGTAATWETGSYQRLATFNHEGTVHAVDFAPGGELVATAGADRIIRLWNPRTGEEIAQLKGHDSVVSDLVFSADGGTLASSSWDHSVRLWDTFSRQELRKLDGHRWGLASVAISRDGRFVAGGGGYGDPHIRLWDTSSGELKSVLTGHLDEIHGLAFTPDGAVLVSVSGDQSVRLWDVGGGREIGTLFAMGDPLLAVALAPGGETIALGTGRRTIRIWSVEDLRAGVRPSGQPRQPGMGF